MPDALGPCCLSATTGPTPPRWTFVRTTASSGLAGALVHPLLRLVMVPPWWLVIGLSLMAGGAVGWYGARRREKTP